MRRREFIAGLGATITGSIQTNAQELPSLDSILKNVKEDDSNYEVQL